MEEKLIANQQGQLEANTSTMSEGEKFLMELEAQGYSTDMIGQGFVMHLPRPKRETQDTQAGNNSANQKQQKKTGI